jgi:hypothetical protein
MKTRIAEKRAQAVLSALLLIAAATWLGAAEIVYTPLTEAGHKTAISADLFIVYEFSERPQMGTVILKIQVFDKGGNKVTPVTIQGRSGMPSMPGHHDSGNVDFKLSRKNDYLLPVDVVMPGDWEVQLTFMKDGKAIFYGRVDFDV